MKWLLVLFFGSAFLYGFLKMPIEAYKEVRREEREAERDRRVREFEAQKERELQKRIRDYLRSGKKIDAIKECKDFYECSLGKAKTIVSEIEFEMAYEREHGEDYRPNAHGQAHWDKPVIQTTNKLHTYVPRIDGMDGHEFEHFCADLLLKNGFEKADVTPGSGDQGVDIIAVKDDIRYAIQCKNYKTPLSNTPVQEVSAGRTFYGCHVGVVMTNSTFTSGAQKLADATGVLLWGRTYVEKLMEKAGVNKEFSDSSTDNLAIGYDVACEEETKGTQSVDVSSKIQLMEQALQKDFSQRYFFDIAAEKNSYNRRAVKSKTITLLLCIFLGHLGVHRFYLGKIGTGIVWLLTCGCFGVGWIVDIVLIALNRMKDSAGNEICEKLNGQLNDASIILLEINYWMNQITDEIPEDLTTAVEQLIPEENHLIYDYEIYEVCEKLFSYCCQIKYLSLKYKDACYRFFQIVLNYNKYGWTTEDSFLETHQKLRDIVADSLMKFVDNIKHYVVEHSLCNSESESLRLLSSSKEALDNAVYNIDLAKVGFEKMKHGISPTDS